jgi:hypothetical protein
VGVRVVQALPAQQRALKRGLQQPFCQILASGQGVCHAEQLRRARRDEIVEVLPARGCHFHLRGSPIGISDGR